MFSRLSCFSSPVAAEGAPASMSRRQQQQRTASAPSSSGHSKPVSKHTRSHEPDAMPPTASSSGTLPRRARTHNSLTPTRRDAAPAQSAATARSDFCLSPPINMMPINAVLQMPPPILRATTTGPQPPVNAAVMAPYLAPDEQPPWQHRSLYRGSGSRPLILAIDPDTIEPASCASSSQGHQSSSPLSATSPTGVEHLAPAFAAHVSRANSFVSPPSPRVLTSELVEGRGHVEKSPQSLSRQGTSSDGCSSASSEHGANSSAVHSTASSSNTLPTRDSSPSSNDGHVDDPGQPSKHRAPSVTPTQTTVAPKLAPIDTSQASKPLHRGDSLRQQRAWSEPSVRFTMEPSPVDSPLLHSNSYPRTPAPHAQFPRPHTMTHHYGGGQHSWALHSPPPPLMGSTWGAGAYAPPAPERKTTQARILSSLRPSSAHGHYHTRSNSSCEHSPTGGRSVNASPAASLSRGTARGGGTRPTSWSATAHDADALAAALAAQKQQRRHSAYGSEGFSLRPPPSPAPSHGSRRAFSVSTVPSVHAPLTRGPSPSPSPTMQRARSTHLHSNSEPRWCQTPTLTSPRSFVMPSSASADMRNFSRPTAHPPSSPEPAPHAPSPSRSSRRSHPPSASRWQVHVPASAAPGAARGAPQSHEASASRLPSVAFAQPPAQAHTPQRRLSRGSTLPEVTEHVAMPTTTLAATARPVRPTSPTATRPSLHSLAIASHGHVRRSLAHSSTA